MATRDFATAYDLEARHLLRLAEQGRLSPVWCRDDLADTLAKHLDAGKSVLLVGPQGVGKSSVIRRAAQRMAAGLAPRRPLVTFATAQLGGGASSAEAWRGNVAATARRAADEGAALVISDITHLIQPAEALDGDERVFDVLEPLLQDGRLQLVGDCTPAQLAHLSRAGLTEHFAQIAVEPLTAAEQRAAVSAAITERELAVGPESLDAIMQLTSRFINGRPQPGPALDLLAQVSDYADQKASIDEHTTLDVPFVERVFAIYSGLPAFVVSQSATRSASDIRGWFDQRLLGQTEAVDAVVQSIAMFKSGLSADNQPLGSFLFVGPTGVGKTELARALATYLYGSPHRLLRVDLSGADQPDSLRAQLDERGARGLAPLAERLREQPFQVVLFEEADQAHPTTQDALLDLLDTGRLTSERGHTLDFRSTFVIVTSNVGAEEADRPHDFHQEAAVNQRRADITAALGEAFRPELLARFQHLVHFQPLTRDSLMRIARNELGELLTRDGITSRNLVVDVDDEAIELVLRRGFNVRWGARGLKRELQRQLVMPLALTLMEHRVDPGQVLKVSGRDGSIRVRRLDTVVERLWLQERAPIRLAARSVSLADLSDSLRGMQEAVELLSRQADEDLVAEDQARLQERRQEYAFWQDPDQAARDLRDLDRSTLVLDRLDRLRNRLDAFETDLASADARHSLEALTERVEEVEETIAGAFRELVYMGRDGFWDALVEIKPLGRSPLARDVLVRLYSSWCEHTGHSIRFLRDPIHPDEPVLVAIRGPYAFGLLRLEAGIHRVTEGDDEGECRVTVAAWTDRRGPLSFHEHRALKAVGRFDGKVRSRLVCEHDLVLQNGNVLAQNRDLAVEIASSWAQRPPVMDGMVRRYDLSTPLVRDFLTGLSSSRTDVLAPERFQQLLCRRVEAASDGPTAA